VGRRLADARGSSTSRYAADGIVAATEGYDQGEPVNLGRGEELAIRDLALLIAEKSGFHGEDRLGRDEAERPTAPQARRHAG